MDTELQGIVTTLNSQYEWLIPVLFIVALIILAIILLAMRRKK